MIQLLVIVAVVLFFLSGIRLIHPAERGIAVHFGRRGKEALGPGFVFLPRIFYRLERVSIEPFSVSLPPQSAITKDEIPIQLQSSLQARVDDAQRAVTAVRDWRIYIMSQLQDLMKERLEDLDFDHLEEKFPEWIDSLRKEFNKKADDIGVEIVAMQISNLSPRTKPM